MPEDENTGNAIPLVNGAIIAADQAGPLIGRDAELASLAELLGRSRLVTVTGIGGVGKTRLALRAAVSAAERAAGRTADGFADGACIAELSALSDPELLAHSVASALGLAATDSRPHQEIVLGYLRERKLLLILDTCELHLEACARFAEAALAQAPGLTILATSREPLNIPGEQEFFLAPLPVDSAGGAVDLFAWHAAQTVPGFTVTSDNDTDVIGLCQRMDGVPLAIKLAAGQLRTQSLAGLNQRLAERFAILNARVPGAGAPVPGTPVPEAPRHRSLRDAIGWSYDLCGPAEQALWERLSVFRGPFGADAAAQVCAGRELAGDAVQEAIFGLTDKSVLVRATDDGGAPRFRMLDTIREYGAERLAASGLETGVRVRLINRYRTLAQEYDTSPLAGQLDRQRALRRDHDGLRAALDYAVSTPGQESAAASLAVSLHWYWQISGLIQEGCYWLTRVLDLFPHSCPERARALGLRGFLAGYGGDTTTCLADTTAALTMAEDLPGYRLLGRAWLYHVRALLSVGKLADAEESGHVATKLLTATGDLSVLPILDVMIAYKYFICGEHDRCLDRCESGLRRIPADQGERWATSYLIGLSGLVMLARGNHELGSEATRKGMAMKRELGDLAGIAYGLNTLAMVSAGEGRFERVTWLLGASDPLWERLGSVMGGDPDMQDRMTQIAAAAEGALGDRYPRLRRTAATVPLDLVVSMAIDDDEVPALTPAGQAR